jgi:DNA-binding YbaB/EbfC family protein
LGKGMGDFMRQAQKLQDQIQKMQEELGDKTVEASSGGGMVTVVANGRQEVVSITIDPEVVNRDDVEMLQDLIVAAVNEAKKRSQELMAAEMSRLTGGMGIPGLF